ncbi:MAG: hypothetical protein O8C63_03060 [Candidatus Methanoperedens sp.]|nr:hypothetical protein [Candidatus Methanoperedens sp.]
MKSEKSESAQVTIDYITGIGIFLLAVIFVFQFVYGLFVPFQSGSDKATLAADRAGTVLVERLLHADKASELNVIDEGKLSNFYVKLKNNETDVLKQIGLFSNQTFFDLNISVVNITSNSLMNQSGPALPETTDIGQTKRLVLIVNPTNGNQTYAIMSVRVW